MIPDLTMTKCFLELNLVEGLCCRLVCFLEYNLVLSFSSALFLATCTYFSELYLQIKLCFFGFLIVSLDLEYIILLFWLY